MKTTKRILAIVITLMMIIPTSMFFSVTSSAGHPDECPDCGGTYWEPWITTVDPTCDTPGYGIMRCGTCGFSTNEYEEIPPYGHFPGRYYVTSGGLSQVCALCKTWMDEVTVPTVALNGNSRIRAIAGYFNAYQGANGTYYQPSWLKDGDAAYINTNVSDLFERVASQDGSWYIIGKGGDDTWYHYTSEFKSTYCMPNIILASQYAVDGNILDAGVHFKMHSVVLGDKHANYTNTGWTYNALYGSSMTCSNLISYAYTFQPITQRLSHGRNDMWNDGIVQSSTRGIEKSVKDAGGGFLCNFVGKTIRATTNTDLICYFFMPVQDSGTVPTWVNDSDARGSAASNKLGGKNAQFVEESYTYTFNQSGMNYSYDMAGEDGIDISFEEENGIVRMIINDHVIYTCGGDRSNRKVEFKYNGVEYSAEQYLENVGPAMIMNYYLGVDGYSALAVNGCNYPDNEQAEAEYFADFTLYSMDGIPANASAQAVAQKTVTFDANGGAAVSAQTVDKGTVITLPSTTKTGLTFAGWTDGSNTYNAGASYTVNADVTLTAIWKAVASFNANGGTGSVDDIVADEGATITMPSGAGLSKAGCEFLGWAFSSTATTAVYRAGASAKLNGNMTFYAVWKQSETPVTNYTVTFNAAGGAAVSAQTVAAGTAITLPATTRSGYDFAGWSDGSRVYQAGASYTVNANVTLTAQWTEQISYDEIALVKDGAYDVKVVGLDASKTYTIRYATGNYTSANAVKNGTNAGFVTVRNAAETVITLPTTGLHTVAVITGSSVELLDTVTIELADLKVLQYTANDLNLKVENLADARYVRLNQNGAGVLTISAKNFSNDGLKTWAEFAAPAAGTYDIVIAYNDQTTITGTVTLTAPVATVTTNGRIFTVADFGGANNVSYMRLAKGVITTANGMKAASDLRTYGAKYFKADTSAFAALDAVNGTSTTYTIQVAYVSGYSQFITFEITPTVPVITTTANSITIGNAGSVDGDYYIDWVRVAPGVQTSLYAIRHAAGSQVKKTADIANGAITFTGLSAGTYSIFYLYDGWNLSEGLVTAVVG